MSKVAQCPAETPSVSIEAGRPPLPYRRLPAMVAAGWLVRLAVMWFLVPERLDPGRNHWRFAWETGMIANALASGHGFSSPFSNPTGPTAWLGPLFPWLLAGTFRVFGTFSRASALAILSLNCLFSALTCISVYCIARRAFGDKTAAWAGWTWAFFPYAIFLSAGRIWENSLTALLMSTLLCLILRMRNGARPLTWAGVGLLTGVAALSNPVVLSIVPGLLLWCCWGLHARRLPWKFPLLLTTAATLLVVLPWMVRDYRVFGQLIPIRGNFWAEVRFGNTGDLSDVYPDWVHPSHNDAEWREYSRLGETAYMARERQLALEFIRHKPDRFALLTLRRIGFVWTGFWSWSPAYRANEPFQIPNTLFCSAWTLLMLLGLHKAWRQRNALVLPFVLMLLILPLPYYVTHPSMDYRHIIDPVIVMLAVYGIAGQKAAT